MNKLPDKDLDPHTFADLKKWFSSYVQDVMDRHPDTRHALKLKEDHTFRVCEEIVGIGRELALEGSALLLAEICALLHDVGRFEQFARYRTFGDHRSVNHGEWGVKILQEKGVLKNLDQTLQDVILKSILYHNRPSLPAKESESVLFFARLLRDADKLDIWRIMTESFREKKNQYGGDPGVAFGLPDSPEISEPIYHNLINGRVADVACLKTMTDYKLLLAGLVYDVNFIPTFQRVMERRYLDIIRETLPLEDRVREIYSVVESFLREKSTGSKRENHHDRMV